MPRKKGQQVLVQLPGEEEEEDKSVTEQEVDDAVERADSEAPTKIESRIFRRHPATGNREQITDTVDSDAVTADFLRQQYGGGYYRVQVIGPMKGKAGKMGRGILRQHRFEIDVTIPPKHPSQMLQPATAPNAEREGSALDAAVATMLTSMIQQSSQMAATQMQAQQTMQTMQMQMMKDHSQMLGAQLEALRPKPERDPLEVLKEAASIIRPNESRGFGEFVKEYTAFKELIGDAGEKETSWLDVVREVAPGILDAAARRDGVRRPTKVRAAIPSTTPGALPSGTGTPNDSVAKEGTGDVAGQPGPNVNPNIRFIAPVMPRVIKWAAQGRDAGLCAEWLLSEIPAGFYPVLREQLSAPTFMDDIVAAFPTADTFKSWIVVLRDAMIRATEPEEDATTDDAEEDDDTPE